MRFSASILTALTLGTISVAAQEAPAPSEKPTIYNHVTKEGSPYDQAVRDAYAAKYTVVDLADSPAYAQPKRIAGGLPKVVRTDFGEGLSGYVLVAYVITTDGRAIEPFVLKSTDERLNSTTFKAIENWRFQPAKLHAVPISTIAAQEFTFKKP